MLERISNQMSSRVSLLSLARTNAALFETQQQLSSGRSLTRTSDSVVNSITVGVLDDRLLRSAQLQRNYQHATSALGEVDSTLEAAHELALEAKSLASSQLAVTASASERASQARVVDGLIQGLFALSNRQGVAGYVLGGSTPDLAPVVGYLGGYRVRGNTSGLTTDLETGSAVPITLGKGTPLTAQGRVEGLVDFSPTLSSQTRLSEVAGARGGGLRGADGLPASGGALGSLRMSFGGNPPVQADLAGADTVEDVRVRLEATIRRYEADQNVTILGPGGVSLGTQGLVIDIAGTGTTPTLEFSEIGTGTTAQDLGLISSTLVAFSPSTANGGSLAPQISWRTPVANLAGVAGALGSIRLSNGSRSAAVDLSSAITLGDVRNIIRGAGLAVDVEINARGDGIDIVNQLASASSGALSIGEVAGSGPGNAGDTAARLGIRTFSLQTPVSRLNHGRGVEIIDNITNPVTGQVDPGLNVDFEVLVGDSASTAISIDLRPADMTTVGDMLARINSQLASGIAAAGLPVGSLTAGLAADGNGMTITRGSGVAASSPVSIRAKNNSRAAEQMGLLRSTFDGASGTLQGEDRAKVRSESLFTALADLRENLARNNATGIALAGELVETMLSDLSEMRGLVGGHGQRVESAQRRESDRATLDESVRSQLRDVDYTKAATRYSLLQTQLEAGLRTTAALSQRSLLDYLG